jgi:hypothetical protein
MSASVPKLKAKGERGWWFATIQGTPPEGIHKVIPCVHNRWRGGERNQWYHDPHAVPNEPKWAAFIDAIKTKRQVILTRDSAPEGMKDGVLPRLDYIAVFEINDFEVGSDYLRFRFGRRRAHLE